MHSEHSSLFTFFSHNGTQYIVQIEKTQIECYQKGSSCTNPWPMNVRCIKPRLMAKNNLTLILVFVGSFLFGQGNVAGIWKAIDDVDGKPTSHIEIFNQSGEMRGKIIKIYDEPEDVLCELCKGDKKDQPVLGMEIMWNMKIKGEEWGGGKIMDPENGRTYKCKMKVAEDGTLKVRGYIGIPLLGRTQSWYRVDE